MDNKCKDIRQDYENIKTLKKEFDLELDKAIKTGNTVNIEKADELKTILEKKRDEIKEKISSYKWDLYSKTSIKEVEYKENYKVKETLEGHGSSVLTLQVLPDGRIVSGGNDNTIKIWDA